MAHKAYNIYSLAFYRKGLLTPVLGEEGNPSIVSAGRKKTKDWISSQRHRCTVGREAREGFSKEIT